MEKFKFTEWPAEGKKPAGGNLIEYWKEDDGKVYHKIIYTYETKRHESEIKEKLRALELSTLAFPELIKFVLAVETLTHNPILKEAAIELKGKYAKK